MAVDQYQTQSASTAATLGPLSGMRVVDFGQYLAGPGTGMILADQGADVIRVERPGGPSMPGPVNAVLNRGKRGVVLDLKTNYGLAIACDLIAGADVVIENFRPGVMTRLGLGATALMDRYPRLVYLSLPGFYALDAEYSGTPGWEGVIAAAMGQFTDMGLNRVLMGVEASYSPLTLASAYASVFGALSVVLAIRARQQHGRGDFIEVPLAAALMEALAYNSMWLEDMPKRYMSLREREIARRRSAALPMNLTHRELQSFLDPFYRTYMCRDGRPFYVVSVSHVAHAERALKILGIWEELVAAGIPRGDPYRPIRDWPGDVDSTIKAHPVTEPWASRISGRMAEAFLTKNSDEWERLFGEAGAPGAAHRTTLEWLRSAHPREAGLLIDVADPEYGCMVQPGPIAWLVSAPPVAGAPYQRPPADGSMAMLWRTQRPEPNQGRPTSTSVRPNAEWLEGITILDMTNVIAGPTIAGTLARFGARVIKIDPVQPTFDPWNTIVMGIYSNRGKESMLLDVKTAQGRETLARLVKRADVITINASDKQLAPLGLDFEQLRRLNPRLILCHLDAFGGPFRGPRSNYPGYDDLVQASTGVMERFGGSLESVEEHAHFGTIDVLAGLCAALATSIALLHRETTGKGQVARSSLAAAGQWLQARFMYDFVGRPPFDEPRGPEAKGEGPYYRCYRARDGWFFLAARADLASAATAKLLTGPAPLQSQELEVSLAQIFNTQPVAVWRDRLRELGVAVQPLNSLSRIRGQSFVDPDAARTIRFLRDSAHPSGHMVEHIDPTAIRPSQATVVPLSAAPKYGHHTRDVLRELGFKAAEIDELAAANVIADAWSDDYLPN
jgi:crotonobetainyl-CoA:carnitine CoA-transferase CaiB-like acyl-CoA transferase